MIRSAEPGDAAAVAAIWNGVIRRPGLTFTADDRTEADVREMIATRAGFLVAIDGARILGFATWTQFRAGRGYARTMEHTLHLSPATRGQGVGRSLLAEVEIRAAAGGAHVLVAAVSAENPAGRAFHLACGFAEAGVLREVGCRGDRWLDLHLLTKRIGA